MNGHTAVKHGRIGKGLQWAEEALSTEAVGVRADRSRRSFRSKTCSEAAGTTSARLVHVDVETVVFGDGATSHVELGVELLSEFCHLAVNNLTEIRL